MTTWTIDQMLAEHPCAGYDRARITDLWAGRDAIATRDILVLDIPAVDRIWAALHDPIIGPRVVERIVTRAVTTHALTCGVPAVETWARRWLSGDDRTQAAACAAGAAEAAGAARAAGAAWAAEAAEAARAAGAARAAWAARAAEAAWAAWAAEAAGAAWAAEAARAAEWARQLADIRAVLDEDDAGRQEARDV